MSFFWTSFEADLFDFGHRRLKESGASRPTLLEAAIHLLDNGTTGIAMLEERGLQPASSIF